MCLRDRLRASLRRVLDRFSGEYSAVAPEKTQPYARDLGEDPTRQVVRPRIPRPTDGGRRGEGPRDRDA
jgi:hypothetical protein